MFKNIRKRGGVLLLAGTLAFGLPVALSTQGCSTLLYRTNPDEAFLLGVKSAYEAGIKQAGYAYRRGDISREQLHQVVGVARKVQFLYNEVLIVYFESGKLQNLEDLNEALGNLEGILSAVMSLKEKE